MPLDREKYAAALEFQLSFMESPQRVGNSFPVNGGYVQRTAEGLMFLRDVMSPEPHIERHDEATTGAMLAWLVADAATHYRDTVPAKPAARNCARRLHGTTTPPTWEPKTDPRIAALLASIPQMIRDAGKPGPGGIPVTDGIPTTVFVSIGRDHFVNDADGTIDQYGLAMVTAAQAREDAAALVEYRIREAMEPVPQPEPA